MNKKKWNKMNSTERYEFLRQWYPDTITINKFSLLKWSQLPSMFRDRICALARVGRPA